MNPFFPDDIHALSSAKVRLETIAKNIENQEPLLVNELRSMQQMENPDEQLIQKLTELKNKHTEFTNIYNSILKYLERHCVHSFTDDYIDVCPESSMNIRYCIHCYKPLKN